jgi:DNA polymerase-3 subunit delta'
VTTSLLLDTARRGELHHSIILAGPVLLHLRTLALSIAKSLNCLNRTSGDACGSCQKIDRGIHPDVQLVGVAEERKLISVEQVRTLVAGAALRPFEGRYKVFIIDPAEALSVSGENALLKTLEEPVRDTVFLLLTRSADLLLPTIRSRSQMIYIPAHATASVGASVGAVEQEVAISIQAARLRQLALWATAGELRVAENIAREVLAGLREMADGNAAALLRLAGQLAAQDDVSSSLALLAALFRDLAGLPPADSLDPQSFGELQRAFSREQFLACASLALRAMTRLEVNADVRLMVEQSLLPLTQQKTPAH